MKYLPLFQVHDRRHVVKGMFDGFRFKGLLGDNVG